MQSNYNQGFSCQSIDKIIQLIESSRGSYSLSSLVDDFLKLNTMVKRNQLENTILLLSEINIIETTKSKLYIKKKITSKKIKELIQYKLFDDGVFDLLISLSYQKDETSWIDPKRLYIAKHAGVLGILIFIKSVEKNSDGYKINHQNDVIKRHLKKSPEQLKAEQKAQEERGERAEIYILEKELKRLKGHPNIELVRRISLENVAEGYDIQSFKDLSSESIDKLIEVKSHFNSKRIFWSINEIRKAAKEQKNYYLYIVDSAQIDQKDYNHREIENPYQYFQIDSYIKEGRTDKFKIEPQNFAITLLKNDIK